MSKKATALSAKQRTQLAKWEAIVDKHMESWQDAAKAIFQIYRNRFYGRSLEKYCLDKWGWKSPNPYIYAHAGAVLHELPKTAAVKRLLPAHCEELYKAKDRKKLWEAVKTLSKITVQAIADKRKELFPEEEVDDSQKESPLESYQQDTKRMSRVAKKSLIHLMDLRRTKEGGLQEMLVTPPIGLDVFVLLIDGEAYRVHRYHWDDAEDNGRWLCSMAAELDLVTAVATIDKYMPHVMPSLEAVGSDWNEDKPLVPAA